MGNGGKRIVLFSEIPVVIDNFFQLSDKISPQSLCSNRKFATISCKSLVHLFHSFYWFYISYRRFQRELRFCVGVLLLFI